MIRNCQCCRSDNIECEFYAHIDGGGLWICEDCVDVQNADFCECCKLLSDNLKRDKREIRCCENCIE